MKKVYKIIGGFLGIIALSLIGNALWEIVIKPSYPYLRDFFLNIASLGIESLKDSTYESIAKGFHEYPTFAGMLTRG